MKVLNIHKRTIAQPSDKIAAIIETLASKNDQAWPTEKWPSMRLDNGLQVGSKGGHGPIRYTIEKYSLGN